MSLLHRFLQRVQYQTLGALAEPHPDLTLYGAYLVCRYDGDVYTALLDMAKVSPLNATQAGPAWEEVLKPAMHRKPVPKL